MHSETDPHLAPVPVAGGALTVATWGDEGPLVVALHGITSSHRAFGLIGPALGTDHRLVAPDLRGRGGSRDLPGPYGMAAHARDVADVVAAYGGGPVVLVGHSMGGFAALATARRYPDLVSHLVLVDGGAPLPLPPGVAGTDTAQAIAATVGVAFARLSMTFPDRQAYRDLWRAHPSFARWSDEIDRYVEYDLVGTEPELRPACRLAAAVADAQDLYALAGVTPAAPGVPAVFLRAPRGMLDEPDAPLNPPGHATHWLPGVDEREVPGVNHYTITLGPDGAAAVVAAVREVC